MNWDLINKHICDEFHQARKNLLKTKKQHRLKNRLAENLLSSDLIRVRMWSRQELDATLIKLEELKKLESEQQQQYTGSIWPEIAAYGLDEKRHYFIIYRLKASEKSVCGEAVPDLKQRQHYYMYLTGRHGLRSIEKVRWTKQGVVSNFSLLKSTNKKAKEEEELQLMRLLK